MKNIIYQRVINLNKKELTLQFIGILGLLMFVWDRFIRERLPREIPFNSSVIIITILFFICLLHLYKTYKIIKPSAPSPTTQKLIEYFIVKLKPIFLPLFELNKYLLSKGWFLFFIELLLGLLYRMFKNNSIYHGDNLFIYCFFVIIPRIVFTFCLAIDCFYFQHLYLLYDALLIITFPLLTQYLFYVSQFIKKDDTDFLDKHFVIEITSKDFIYEEGDYDDEGFLKDYLPRHFTDPSALDYNKFYDDCDIDWMVYSKEEIGLNFGYVKSAYFVDNQETAICFDRVLYSYKILYHTERKDKIFVANSFMAPVYDKRMCKNLLDFHIGIAVLKYCLESQKGTYGKKYYGELPQNIEILLSILSIICWGYILIKTIYAVEISTESLLMILEQYTPTLENDLFSNFI